jgi:hypothetical protein
MAWLEHTPRVLTNTTNQLKIEEPHFGRFSLIFTGIFLGSLFVIPAIASGSWVIALIGLILGVILVGGPFLLVLSLTRYRLLEVATNQRIRCTAFNTFFSPRSSEFAWHDIAKIVYERRRDAHPHRLGRLRVTLHTTTGKQVRLLRGWHSEELNRILSQHIGDKYEYIETRSPW